MKSIKQFFNAVIPAKAGIQLSFSKPAFKLDPRLRGGDGPFGVHNSKAEVTPC